MPQAYKQTEIGQLPFDWDVKRVSEVFEVYGGTTPSTSIKANWNGEVTWITPTDMTKLTEGNFISRSERKITFNAVKKSGLKILDDSTLLITSRATIGLTALNKNPVTINQGMTALIPKEISQVDTLFYSYYFQSMKSYLEQLGAGSTFREISRATIQKLKIPLPPLPEQQKIAEILSTVDEAIGKTDQAIEKTERLKKGMMAELLSGRRYTVDGSQGKAERRFKKTEIGEIPVEWGVVRIKDVFQVYGGTTPSTTVKKYWNGEIPWVTPTDITKINGKNYINSSERLITKEAINATSLKVLDKETLLLTSRATIGFTALNSKPMTINQGMTALIPRQSNKLNSLFYAYYFRLLKSYLEQLGSGSTFREVARSTIQRIRIPLPPLPEQKQIASILSTVDERLEMLGKRKEKLVQVKKWLMNDLLTGRKRVKV